MTDIAFSAATKLCADLAERRLGCVELLEHYLSRVDSFNADINAIVVTDIDRARARAAAADAALARGESWGPLHGLPMTLKESFDIEGLPTTWGLPALNESIAGRNAVQVDRLLNAGAVIFGKTNVPLLLADFQSYNQVYGTTNNPWDLSRTPGGSSGGSAAALASGMTGLEAGSDIGGSIRNPAHYCGVYGLKPTWGVLPPRGHAMPGILTPSDISVVGPLARSAGDLDLALSVMAGPDVLQAAGWTLDLPPARQQRLGDFRVAVWSDSELAPVDTEVADRLQQAVEAIAKAGADIDDRARPEIDFAEAHRIYLWLLYAVVTSRQPPEAVAAARERLAGLADDDYSDGAVATRATVGYHRDWLAANEARTHMRYRWHDFFQDHDLLLCPICVTAAFPHDQSEDSNARTLSVNGAPRPYFQQLFWAGLTGAVYLPSVIAPIGRTSAGLPVGLQIVAPEYGERTAIRFAQLLSDVFGGFEPPPAYAG